MRDESVHLIISQVPKDILALFQACTLNYHKRLSEWFSISLSDRVTVGMMTIVYDFNPDQFDLNNPLFRRKLGRDAANYLVKFQAEVKKEFESLGKPAEFSIDIGYKLALVKKVGEADIVLSVGNVGNVVGVLEVPKDPSKTHPHRRTEVFQLIDDALQGKVKVTVYDIQCIIQVYYVKKRPEFCYHGSVKNSPIQYSDEFVTWILQEYNKNNNFFIETREKMKRHEHQDQ